MTREEKKKLKEEEKRIKAINNSLSYLSKEMQEELGVVSIQKDEGAYYCGNGVCKRIYMFQPYSLGNKRIAFIKAITDRFNNRIRFTMCTKNREGSFTAYMFMTVFFEADSYFEAKKLIADFENTLIKDICVFLDISIQPCSIDNTLTYIHMNCSGEMSKISTDVLFSNKNGGIKLIDGISNCNAGSFNIHDRYGKVFIGKNYERKTNGINDFIRKNNGTYYIVVDFQGYTEDEQRLFNSELKARYGYRNNVETPHLINMSYFLTITGETEDIVTETSENMIAHYDKNGIQLMPGVGREADIVRSCCSLGLVDFHSGQNVTCEIVGGLLL